MNAIPSKINLGSGKAWKEDYLNIDVNAFWRPDIIADFNQPFFTGAQRELESDRFGRISIHKNSIELIIAHDVLEHMRELITCMKNCLDLLVVDGILDVIVPYDLSMGAWQDPTHVRAFNERSWLYYTDWFWYLGWNEYRFSTHLLEFQLSSVGLAMRQEGVQTEVIARTPRAIDAMHVKLKKIALCAKDMATFSKYAERN